MSAPRNPADLIGITRNVALRRLLSACGISESRIRGASDYDVFLALAEAMPLCVGHPLRDEVNRTLQEAVGGSVSLCPHTAEGIWRAWTERSWYGREDVACVCGAGCPLCGELHPKGLTAEEIIRLPHPVAVVSGDAQAWSHALEAALTGEYALFSVAESYRFTRPNPYHVGLAVAKAAAGEALTEQENNLLITQAMRVWGLWMGQGNRNGALLLRGGNAAEVTALLAYLHREKALPRLIWIPSEPTAAGNVSGLYPDVGTGVDLSACRTAEEEQTLLKRYAAVAPMGRAVVIRPDEGDAPRSDPDSL